jgi:hypothetical protein
MDSQSPIPRPDRGLTIRGRFFSEEDLKLISELVLANFAKGRTRASLRICELLDWRQPNGWLKDRACRDVLRTLEARGALILPSPKSNSSGNSRRATATEADPSLETSALTQIPLRAISFSQVKGTIHEALWNAIVRRYHYRGYRVLVGRSLKYLILFDGRIIGAWGVSDCAWSLSPRDAFLSRLGFDPSQLHTCVINNSRFLLLPWVKVKNLASFVLAKLVKLAQLDWSSYYAVTPLFLETFVEPEAFLGTCYRAANWFCIGTTKGYKKTGSSHSNSQEAKLIFLYALDRKLTTRARDLLQED